MQITPVKQVSFGYDAKYHKRVHEELSKSKHDKELAKYLIETDNLSLRVEDEIVAMEKDSKKFNTERFGLLTEFLRDIKQNIAFYMNYSFPKLDYPENLIYQYSDEVNEHSKKPHKEWRMKMVDSLIGFAKVIPAPEDEQHEKEASEKEELKNEAMKTLDEVGKQAVDNYKDQQSKARPSIRGLPAKILPRIIRAVIFSTISSAHDSNVDVAVVVSGNNTGIRVFAVA